MLRSSAVLDRTRAKENEFDKKGGNIHRRSPQQLHLPPVLSPFLCSSEEPPRRGRTSPVRVTVRSGDKVEVRVGG